MLCRGILGEPGSSAFMFDHEGVIRVPSCEIDETTDPSEVAIEAGAEDVLFDNDSNENTCKEQHLHSDSSVQLTDEQRCVRFICNPSELSLVSKALQAHGYTVTAANLEYLPKTLVYLKRESYEKALNLVHILSEHSDVTEVYDNFTLESSETTK